MSKVEKALERAKAERHTAKGKPKGLAADEGFGLQGPAYAQTKVISLDKGRLAQRHIMTLLDDPEAMDCYNLLRTQLLKRTRDKALNAIMITSVIDGEGKTMTAINLAVSMAREVKQTVLLVDADLRNPKIHDYLGFPVEKGLVDYLLDDVPVAELLINPGLAKMVVFPAGRRVSGSTDIFGSPRMEHLVAELKRRYPERYVLFDCSPVLSTPDALIFSAYVDGVILVVEAGKTPKEQIHKAVELLEGRNILGLVMNKSKEAQETYYY